MWLFDIVIFGVEVFLLFVWHGLLVAHVSLYRETRAIPAQSAGVARATLRKLIYYLTNTIFCVDCNSPESNRTK